MQVEPCAFKDHEYHKNYLWTMNHLVSNTYMVMRYFYISIVGGTIYLWNHEDEWWNHEHCWWSQELCLWNRELYLWTMSNDSRTMCSIYGTMSIRGGTMSNGFKVVEPCKEP